MKKIIVLLLLTVGCCLWAVPADAAKKKQVKTSMPTNTIMSMTMITDMTTTMTMNTAMIIITTTIMCTAT